MAAQPAEALAATGVTIRDAGPDDDVAGVKPRWVALPESTEEIAAVLRAASAHDLAVVPVGSGTKLHWGRPPERCDVLLDTCCLNRVLEHAAGDLVVRVQAGVTMGALAEALAREGQELALDVPDPEATVGGTLAAAVAGPRRLRYGTARDLLIGATVVLADGTIARSGGKVVKNVAGYDLGKLFTGSQGTLGVIAEATFRLHPLPAARAWVTTALPPPAAPGGPFPVDPEPLLRDLPAHPAEPTAVELDWQDLTCPPAISVLVEGADVAGRARAVQELLGPRASVSDAPPGWWGRLPGRDTLIEVRTRRSALAALHAVAARHARRAVIRGTATALRLALPGRPDPEAVARLVTALRAALPPPDHRVVVLAAAPDVPVDRWGPVPALPLLRRVKERFDPRGLLAPGRLGGVI